MFSLIKNDSIFPSDYILSKLENYSSCSDNDKLELLLCFNKSIDCELDRLTKYNGVTYASMLKDALEAVVIESTHQRVLPKGQWSPYKHRLYEGLRKEIVSKIGVLGGIITKDRYNEALGVLKQMGYNVDKYFID